MFNTLKKQSVFIVLLLLSLFVFSEMLHAEEEAKLLLSIQKSKIEDKTGRLPTAERTRMFDILNQTLRDAGFNVILEEDMVSAIQETEKGSAIGGMQKDENGNEDDLQVARYFVQISCDKCQNVLKEFPNPDGTTTKVRVNELSMTIRVVDAKNGIQICLVQNSNPVAGKTTIESLELAFKDLVQLFTKAMPEKFRPATLAWTVIKERDDGSILVKIPESRIKVGVFLDLFRLEELDLGDDDDELEGEFDEIFLGTVKVTETKKAYCVCMPEGKCKKINANESRKDIARISTRKK